VGKRIDHRAGGFGNEGGVKRLAVGDLLGEQFAPIQVLLRKSGACQGSQPADE